MAWVSIAASDYDPDSPITTTLAGAWSNNPTAIANGDSGAPPIQTAAIANNAVTGDKLDIDAMGSYATTSINSGTAWTPTKGVWMFTVTSLGSTPVIQIKDGAAAWQGTGTSNGGCIATDGSNVRVIGDAIASTTIAYRKLI